MKSLYQLIFTSIFLFSCSQVFSKDMDHKKQKISTEEIVEVFSKIWGGCSNTITASGTFTALHCVEDLRKDHAADTIILANQRIEEDALKICTTKTSEGDMVTSMGWPGIFPGQARTASHEVVRIEEGQIFTTGLFLPGQSGGPVIRNKGVDGRPCVDGVIKGTGLVGGIDYGLYLPFSSVISFSDDYVEYNKER